jgi:hypothetical protein
MLPLTQEDLVDAMGLTSVHVNRTLRRFRDAGSAIALAATVIFVYDQRVLIQSDHAVSKPISLKAKSSYRWQPVTGTVYQRDESDQYSDENASMR